MGRGKKAGKDLLFGVLTSLISLYLLLSPNIVAGITLLDSSIVFARAGTYVRILGGLLLVLSVILCLRALFWKKGEVEEEKEKAHWSMDPLIVIGFVLLLLYMPLMDLTNFTVASVAFTALFAFIIRAREKKVDVRNPKECLKNLIIALGYALILEFVLEFLFTGFLNVNLP